MARAKKAGLTYMYEQTDSDFGLTVRISKAKHMVTWRLVSEENRDCG